MRIEHAALYVNDLERSRDFFVKYFGGESNCGYHNKTTGFRSYFITFGGGARLELMAHPETCDGARNPRRAGFAHIAFSAGSREEVDRLTALLRNDGFEVVSGPRVTGDGYYESCILDPEGNQIEVTE